MLVSNMAYSSLSLSSVHIRNGARFFLLPIIQFFLLLLATVFLSVAHAEQTAGHSLTAPATLATSAQLADLLENEQTRNQLIEQLRTQAPAERPDDFEAGAVQGGTDHSLPRRVADGTQIFLSTFLSDASQVVGAMTAFVRGEPVAGISLPSWKRVFVNLLWVVLATMVAFVLARIVAARCFRHIDHWAEQASPVTGLRRLKNPVAVRKFVAILCVLVIDVIAIAAAVAIGYVVLLLVSGPGRAAGTFESLFINAFLVVEVARSLVQTVFSTRYPHLRLFTMSDEVAAYWNAWLNRLVMMTGYGMLVIVPVLNTLFTVSFGNVAGLLIMVSVYVYAVRGIWSHRRQVHDALLQSANRISTVFFTAILRFFAGIWHVLALVYFTVLLVVSQVNTANALPFMAKATLQSVVAIVLGLAVSAMLTAILSHPIRLSSQMRTRLPLLEFRINSYVPAMLKGLRLITLFLVVLVVLDAWRVFDLSGWVMSASGRAAINLLVQISFILFMALFAWTIIASLIEGVLRGSGKNEPSARERTLLSLLRNAALIVIATMTVLIVLSQLGIDIGPLIAGAGVVGLAVGFGAQKLVQDIITGIFIQLENGMNVDDVVEAGGVFGTVEKMTIRSVGIRTVDGGYHLVPFSSVDVVVNHMRDFSYHMGEYTISHRENVDDAIQHLQAAFNELMQDEVLSPEILENITIPGVTAINERGVTIRILIKTTPGMQWAIQRGYNRLVKKHFNAANIEMPYPHTVVYFGQDKNGNAPAANVKVGQVHHTMDYDDNAPAAGQTPSILTPATTSSIEVLGKGLEREVADEDVGEREDEDEREEATTKD